jgi:hypothetical protein
MTPKHTVKLAILGLAGYGGYALWSRYDSYVSARSADRYRHDTGPSDRRI